MSAQTPAPSNALVMLPELLVAGFKAVMPELRECSVHPGEFTREDIARLRKSAPSLYIATPRISAPDILEDGVGVLVQCAALLCADRLKVQKRIEPFVAAAHMLSAVFLSLPKMLLGPHISQCDQLVARDFTNVKDTRVSGAVWVLTWSHYVMIETPLTKKGVLPSDLYIGFSPNTGPDHEADYIHIDLGAGS